MIVLGIDPGTATMGWGVVRQKDTGLVSVGFECIRTPSKMRMPDRLLKLRTGLDEVVKKYRPEVVVVERIFFNTNAKTAIAVGQARGVIMLVAAENKLPLVEYTALQAKHVLTGYGRADKETVREEVTRRLGLPEKVKSDDAADALAMAICYFVKTAEDKE